MTITLLNRPTVKTFQLLAVCFFFEVTSLHKQTATVAVVCSSQRCFIPGPHFPECQYRSLQKHRKNKRLQAVLLISKQSNCASNLGDSKSVLATHKAPNIKLTWRRQ